MRSSAFAVPLLYRLVLGLPGFYSVLPGIFDHIASRCPGIQLPRLGDLRTWEEHRTAPAAQACPGLAQRAPGWPTSAAQAGTGCAQAGTGCPAAQAQAPSRLACPGRAWAGVGWATRGWGSRGQATSGAGGPRSSLHLLDLRRIFCG